MNKILLLLSSLFFLSNSYALGVKPIVIQKIATQKGASGFFTVTNSDTKEQEIKIYTAPFTYNEKGHELLKNSPNDLSSYLLFSPKKLILAAGESRQVRFNARFLPSTEKKEYRTMIYVEQISTAQTQSSGAGFLPRIGITLYVQLGDMKSDLTVTQANYKDKKLALAVTNTGQATARPRVVWNLEQAGKILVTNEGHKTAFYPTTVIAEGKRNIEIKAPELSQLTNGNYQLIGTLLWGGNKNSLKFNQAFTVTR